MGGVRCDWLCFEISFLPKKKKSTKLHFAFRKQQCEREKTNPYLLRSLQRENYFNVKLGFWKSVLSAFFKRHSSFYLSRQLETMLITEYHWKFVNKGFTTGRGISKWALPLTLMSTPQNASSFHDLIFCSSWRLIAKWS